MTNPTPKIDMNKKYKYRNGEYARILCVDGFGTNYPVISCSKSLLHVAHTEDGYHINGATENDLDLIEIPKKTTRPRELADVIKLLASVPSPCLWIDSNCGAWSIFEEYVNVAAVVELNDSGRNLSLNPFIENPVILGPEIEK